LFCLKHIHIVYIYYIYINLQGGDGGRTSRRMHRNPIHNIFVDTVVSVVVCAIPNAVAALWQLQALRNADPIRQVQIVGRVVDTHGARNSVIRPLLPYRPWNLLGGRETWLEPVVRWGKKMSTNIIVVVLY